MGKLLLLLTAAALTLFYSGSAIAAEAAGAADSTAKAAIALGSGLAIAIECGTQDPAPDDSGVGLHRGPCDLCLDYRLCPSGEDIALTPIRQK
jgi:hypothetical protein